jgi:hypothetical protein
MVNIHLKEILAIAIPLAIVSLFLLSNTGLVSYDFNSTELIAIALSSNEQNIDGSIMLLPQHLITEQCYFEVLTYIHNTGTKTIPKIEFEFLTIGSDSNAEVHRIGYTTNLEPGKSAKVMLTDGGKPVINLEDVLAYNCTDKKIVFGMMVRVPEINEAIIGDMEMDVTNEEIFNKMYLLPLSQYEIKKEI